MFTHQQLATIEFALNSKVIEYKDALKQAKRESVKSFLKDSIEEFEVIIEKVRSI